SSVTAVPDVAAVTPSVVPVAPPVAKKSGAGLIIGVVVLLLVVGGAGIGGFLLWKNWRSTADKSRVGATTDAATAPQEVSRYWLELEPATAGAEPARVAGLVPIASGQSFKFHFSFNESGYLYIFGPGEKNQPTAFLT